MPRTRSTGKRGDEIILCVTAPGAGTRNLRLWASGPTPTPRLVYYLTMPENGGMATAVEARSKGASYAICIAGLLVPGVGHVLLGRWGRGLAFAAAILVLFGLGLAMNGRLYDVIPEQPLHVFAFIANAGAGLAYLVAHGMGLGVGVLSSPNYDYGTTYLWVAGLLNYLVVLDAFDIAQGRKL